MSVRRAFTLLETMVALGLVVLVIGATTAVNRTLSTSGTSAESVTHETALADEAVQDILLTQGYIQQSTRPDKTLATFFGGMSVGQSHYLVPYQTSGPVILNMPIDLRWCMDAGDVDQVANQGQTCRIQPSKVGSLPLSTGTTAQGELIAVNRASGDYRPVVDATTKTNPIVSTSDLNWDFFYRTIQLQEISLVAGVTGKAYQLTVTVTNRDTGTSLVRTRIFTDWKS